MKETKPTRSRRWGAIFAWSVLLLLLVLFGFGLMRREQGSISVGSVVPDFVLTTFDGREISLQDLAGQVVVINFWSSWCLTCDEEAAVLEQAYQLVRDSPVFFLGVNYSDTDWAALDFLEKYGITYPNGADEGTRIAQDFRIRSVPETYIVAPDGTLAFAKDGPFSSVDEILEAIESARLKR
ncbi:MAG TPA: TlpA family protein disulfide reductase [Anaerolineae bacterium]|nr:TlpA family protein disulfide reductase [Anaerolineae bacterium]